MGLRHSREMSNSNNNNKNIPMDDTGNPQSAYDPILDSSSKDSDFGDGRDPNSTFSSRRPARPMWIIIVIFICLFVITMVSMGVLCALDTECSAIHTPSLGSFLNDTDTGRLATTGINLLMATHYMLTLNASYMTEDNSLLAAWLMVLISFLLYVSVYATLLFPYWYVAIPPVVLSLLWMASVTHGLRRYYTYRRRILYYFNLALMFTYAIASTIWVIFSPIPLPSFPGKQVGVFVSEIIMLVSGLLFAILLVVHTRGIKYAIHKVKTVEDYDLNKK